MRNLQKSLQKKFSKIAKVFTKLQKLIKEHPGRSYCFLFFSRLRKKMKNTNVLIDSERQHIIYKSNA